VTPEALLRALFDRAVERALPGHLLPGHLPASPKGRTVVVGAGKAAAMAFAVEEAWPVAARLSGLVVTRYGHVPKATAPLRGAIVIAEARHPVPYAADVAATAQMLDHLQRPSHRPQTPAAVLQSAIAGTLTAGCSQCLQCVPELLPRELSQQKEFRSAQPERQVWGSQT
jgi:glycerate-2-kinase